MDSSEIRRLSWGDFLLTADAPGLIAEYAAECSIPEIGKIDPQASTFQALEDAHALEGLGVYADGKLVGFAGILTFVHPHYGAQIASLDSLFVSAPYRTAGLGTALLRTVEQFARDSGSRGVLYTAPVGSQLETLLAAKRYLRAASTFYRRVEAA